VRLLKLLRDLALLILLVPFAVMLAFFTLLFREE